MLEPASISVMTMEDLGGPQFDSLGATIRKKRSQSLRRPRPEIQLFPESHDPSPLSSMPLSDDLGKVSSDEINGGANFKGKMFNLNHCMSKGVSATRSEGDYPHKKIKEDGGSVVLHNNGILGDGVDQGQSTPLASLVAIGDSLGTENKPKKVKLKVGGVTRTIQTKPSSNGSSSGPFSKTARPSDAPRSRQKLILQDNSDRDHSPPSDKKSSIHGVPWKGISRGGFGVAKEDMGKTAVKNGFEKQGEKSDPVRKSKRVPKRRVLEGAFDEDDEDDEIRYLEKLKSSKAAGFKDFEEESNKKQRSLSRVSKGGRYEHVDESGRSGKDGKKARSERGSEDTDYDEDEELQSDCEPEGKKKKKQKKDPSDSLTENKREMALTTRQRALLYGKDVASASGVSQIEFPNGLPPPPPRKQKEKLTEVEQQLKKAEAAQRRRIQNEKAARESEAEAIRKILGQDSTRKKREDKKKKRQEELAQEKAASAHLLASSTIRWVMGPSGTVVTFPQEMGLPKIFDPKPNSYPPPREKCAAPSCTNPFKYRDSKTKLPLCSFQCYKAIHSQMQMETAC